MAVGSEARVLQGSGPTWEQLTGCAGIVGVILVVVVLGVFGVEEDYPDIDRSTSEIRVWFEDNGTRAQAMNYANALVLLLLFVPFFLGMRAFLAQAEGGEVIWTHLGFFGATLFVVLSFTAMAFTSVLSIAVDELDDATLIALKYSEYITLALAYGLASGLYLLGSGVVIVSTGVLWRWLGWLGIAVGVIAIVGSANVIDPDPESVFGALNFLGGAIGFGLIILLQGVGLLTKRQDALE